MRHGQWAFLVVLSLLLASTASGQAFTANLSGAQEVPPADPDGTGTATILISGTTVNYTIVVNNITPPIAQHIHVGAAGVNGPIVVNLPGTWVGNTLVGTTTTSPATAAAILANPAGHYVNVHTNDFPGGAVRGQLARLEAAIPALSGWGITALALALAVAAIIALKL
jgi:hypothetical protein